MGEAKRRKETLGDRYGQEPNILPGVPIKKSKFQSFLSFFNHGWFVILIMLLLWSLMDFWGPIFGWWDQCAFSRWGDPPLFDFWDIHDCWP